VTGTITSPNLSTWTLEYAGSGSTVSQVVPGHHVGVTGTFDPTVLLNGFATLRLTAVEPVRSDDRSNSQCGGCQKCKVGNFTLAFTDLAIPVAALPFRWCALTTAVSSAVETSASAGVLR